MVQLISTFLVIIWCEERIFCTICKRAETNIERSVLLPTSRNILLEYNQGFTDVQQSHTYSFLLSLLPVHTKRNSFLLSVLAFFLSVENVFHNKRQIFKS